MDQKTAKTALSSKLAIAVFGAGIAATLLLGGGASVRADDQSSIPDCSGTTIGLGGIQRSCVPGSEGNSNTMLQYVDDNSSSAGNSQTYPGQAEPLPPSSDEEIT